MLKRKVLSSGYAASSDLFDEERELRNIPLGQSANKKTKSNPYAPSGLVIGSRSVSLGFQYPGLSSSTRGSVPPAFAVASSSMRNSSAPVSVSNTQASTGVIIGLKAGILTQSTVPGETLSSSDSEAAIPPPNQAGFTVKLNNAAIRQKCDTEDNSIKEHVRSTFYRMLGIVAAKDVRPYFKDEHGELDTPPAQFMDPGWYCQPFPHWRAPLAKQVAWDPYIERFRLAIPNDDSELSNKLRSLTDEQIIVLLNDGPFKLGQTAWRDMKKIE